MLFSFPERAKLDRILTKNKIKEHASLNSKLCLQFTQQIQQIVWKYKLAQNTVNIPATQAIHEIEIFNIILKDPNFSYDLLRCIDLSIPSPIIFELYNDDLCKIIAAYKRPNEVDGTKSVISNYFEIDWFPKEMARTPLPLALNMESLYANLFEPLLPYPARKGEVLQGHVERVQNIIAKEREVEQWETRLRGEKQFNRQVEINAKLRFHSIQLEELRK